MIGIIGDETVEVQLSSDRLLEYILIPDNLNRAYRQVKDYERCMEKLTCAIRGWISYFRLAGMRHFLRETDR